MTNKNEEGGKVMRHLTDDQKAVEGDRRYEELRDSGQLEKHRIEEMCEQGFARNYWGEIAGHGLNDAEAFVWLWQYSALGGFYTYLAEVIARADVMNTQHLRKGFPLETAAIKAYQQIPGWWEEVQKKVEGREDDDV